jgi:FixJ family two-component response regulator
VLVDVEMPRLDGPAMVYQMFVRNCGMENVPIIVSSGIRDVTSVAKRIGTPYFVSKPFDTEQLLAMVRRAVAERALPRPSL